jgi:uncharacterized protein
MEEKNARNWVVFCHLGGLLTILIPLIIWLLKKMESPFIDEQGREIVNYQISALIYGMVLGVMMITVIGIPVAVLGMTALGIISLVSMIRGAIKASNGEGFLYPINLRLIK